MRKVTRAKGNIKGRRAIIEAIEQRTLLSGVTLVNGLLTITGTSGPDEIDVEYIQTSVQPPTSQIEVTFNGQTTYYLPSQIQQVSILGGDGDDNISVYLTGGQSATISGGDGDDTLSCGPGPETLTGDAGNDNLFDMFGGSSLSGGNGDDTIAGSGTDTLDGGDGNDTFQSAQPFSISQQLPMTVLGGEGNDTLVGDNASTFDYSGGPGIDTFDDSAANFATTISLDDEANDAGSSNIHSDVEEVIGPQVGSTIIGDSADNTLIGGAGDDTIIGNGGNDSIVGNGGDDSLIGGSGNDTILGGVGQDTIVGGGGNDSLDGGSGYNTINGVSNSPGGSAAVLGGILTVTGTDQPDFININYSNETGPGPNGGFTLKINGITSTIDGIGIDELLINAGAGDDQISVTANEDSDAGPPVNVVVNDGDGNDAINVQMQQNDYQDTPKTSVTAGNGDDNIFVEGGTNSTVTAGNGNDTVVSSANSDDLIVQVNLGNGNDEVDCSSPGIAGLAMLANVGTGHDVFSNGDDIDMGVTATTSAGQSVGVYDNISVAGSVTVGSSGAPLAGATVFLDSNGNGLLDPGEATATTDAHGNYDLDIPPTNVDGTATYNLRVLAPGYTAAPSLRTEVAQVGQGFSGDNFMLTLIPTATNPVLFGTAGSYRNQGNTIANAVDGNLSTFFDSPTASGGFVALDYGLPQTIKQISFAPRPSLPGRMVGGLFQGSNSPDFSNAVTLYTVTTTPAVGRLTTVNIPNTGTYRYVRYLGSANNYCNIAEMKFVLATNLTGTVIGTSGSYHNQGNTAAKAFDGNLNTFFDAPDATGNWAGLDLGTAKIITQISYAPRSGWASRMVGGMFQASNSADFSSGVVTLYTVTSTPPTGVLTTVQISNPSAYRYVRYIGAASSYCNVAEVLFSGSSPLAFVRSDGTLVVNGTAGGDNITVAVNVDLSSIPSNRGSIVVTVNGLQEVFDATDIDGLLVDTFDGNDRVSITGNATDGSPSSMFPVSIIAGNGNDTIEDSLSTDSDFGTGGIYMGQSASIVAGNGIDTLEIDGTGLATIQAGNGNDQFTSMDNGLENLTVAMVAGNGSDTFTTGSSGGAGSQFVRITAGIGRDYVFNQDPDDIDTGTLGGQAFSIGWQQELLTGKVYVDTNGNGQFDPGEPVVPNAPVSFQNNFDGTVSTTTDSSGNYSLAVNFDPSGDITIPITYIGPYSITLIPGELASGLDIASAPHIKLSGTVIGTSGSYRNHGATIPNVFDGNLSTYFDAPDAIGDWVGLDLGSAKVVTQVKYAPRSGWESRMIGGEIQASNTADFSSGVVTLFTISSTPTAGVLMTQSLTNNAAYRYYRYIGPPNGYCDIAELEFDS